ncbi:hypothetical protein DFO80_13914 [Rhodobacter sp. 140A]|nr:hypothetical protein DFO80_13914 [Rhodobacter sp. 140A]
MSPLAALEWIGRHARLILPAGLVAVPFLPASGGVLAPALPWLVALLIGLAVARVDLRGIARDLVRPGTSARMVAALVLFQPLLALMLTRAGQELGLAAPVLLVLLVFAAAPPLSSAPNLALMLGYDARLALGLTLVGTLLSPLLVPASFWLADAGGIEPGRIALKVVAMLAGGIAIGIALRAGLGAARIGAQARAFDGIGTLIMLAFLFPLMDGVGAQVLATPGRALRLATLAFALNVCGNLVLRTVAGAALPRPAAASAGLAFGNRNISVLLAALPPDPTVSLFVALAQIPIYATPFLLSLLDTVPRRCLPSSES